jgi:hypothetical protein
MFDYNLIAQVALSREQTTRSCSVRNNLPGFVWLQGGRMGIVDRRIRRSQKSLHEALLSLVLEKNYDSITVQEILDRADVGRSTFYAHFEGKDELLISGTHELHNTLNAVLQRERSSAKTLARGHYWLQRAHV